MCKLKTWLVVGCENFGTGLIINKSMQLEAFCVDYRHCKLVEYTAFLETLFNPISCLFKYIEHNNILQYPK